MRNGTQEELDAAREDATKLPFDALFEVVSGDGVFTTTGDRVYRKEVYPEDDEGSIGMTSISNGDYWFYMVRRLGVIK